MGRSPLFLIPFLLFACSDPQKKKTEDASDMRGFYVISGRAQGTSYRIKYAAEKKVKGMGERVDTLLSNVDATFSMYRDSSGVLDVSRAENGACIDSLFRELFVISKEIHNKTNGAFDPTVKPLVDEWGFGPNKEPKGKPDDLDTIMKLVGLDGLSLDTLTDKKEPCYSIQKEDPDIAFDPNAIAQGYTVDLIAALMKERFEIERAMIQLGGEVRTIGRKSKKRGWWIGVEEPKSMKEKRAIKAVAELEDLSMATSGSYRKFYEKNGKRYPHTIDPRTGKPVKHQLLSVTVTHPVCAYADAYATAFMVMGPDKASAFVKEHEKLEAYFIMAKGSDGYKTFATKGMKEMLKER